MFVMCVHDMSVQVYILVYTCCVCRGEYIHVLVLVCGSRCTQIYLCVHMHYMCVCVGQSVA